MSSNSLSVEEFSLCAAVNCIRNAGVHVASMSILYSDLPMHLLLSVKHGMVSAASSTWRMHCTCYCLTY